MRCIYDKLDMASDATRRSAGYAPGAGSGCCNPELLGRTWSGCPGADIGGVTGVFKLMDITFQTDRPARVLFDDAGSKRHARSSWTRPRTRSIHSIFPTGEICVARTEGGSGSTTTACAADINFRAGERACRRVSVSVDVVARCQRWV